MRGAGSKIVVVAWDLAHNAASCAFILADLLRREHDVEIIGPTFLGRDVWEPIRNADIPIRVFPGAPLPGFVQEAERFVGSVEADVVVACKPRFPSLLLSMLIKDQCDAPVILHIDDLELGLVGAGDGISLDELERRRGWPDFANPAGRSWVSACECLIADADAITVSGERLRRRYGGVVVGQPRDEIRFDPRRLDRRGVRAEFGYSDDDRVVLFLGSPRAHKGIVELATAIAGIDDPRIKLCVIGSFNDARLRGEIERLDPTRIQLHDYRPIAEVPRLLMIADLVCLPQDGAADFVTYQTPMKLTEALAMGIPVLARETPALSRYVQRGLLATIGDMPLGDRICSMFDEPARLREMTQRGRAYFLSHLSYNAALRAFDQVIAALPSKVGEVPSSWERACELASSAMSRPR
ncbi:MAG: glycosyltransferase family 4 protein [Solirubrobacteraceae bacterium]